MPASLQTRYREWRWRRAAAKKIRALTNVLQSMAGRPPHSPRFYFVDPAYEPAVGHYACVARALAAECAARGWPFIHLTGPFDQTPADNRIPLFHDHGRLALRFLHSEPEFSNQSQVRASTRTVRGHFTWELGAVLDLDRDLFSTGESYFFFYTGDILHPWSQLRRAPLGPRQHLAVFQFSLPSNFQLPSVQTRFARHTRLLARVLETSKDSSARFRLCTDSPALRRLLTPVLGRQLAEIQPPLLASSDLASLPAPADLANRPHPCGYFGYLTPKHGWPIVLQYLREHAGQKTRWLLALNLKRGEPALLDVARQTASSAGAELHVGFWTEVQYSAALASCSCLLLPYTAAPYTLISSGKLIDALRHACLPVVPVGTWLAEVVQQLGYGLVVAEGDWPGVPARLANLDLPSLWAQRQARVRDFLSSFTARTCLDTLVRASE
ncbi:MAG: hypothetical protein ABSH19_06265 [Opitutales bacterium]|jgi:hypothetical protein